ncbi:MAG: Ig-like domain-containing protein [Dermatophilaceae bacterium]
MSGTTSFTVKSAALVTIQVTPFNPIVPVGFTTPFQATGICGFHGGRYLTNLVTWTSSDTAVASISTSGNPRGILTPIAKGTTSIQAAYQGVTGTTLVTVTDAKLVSITISPDPIALAVGQTLQLGALGAFDDGSTLDVTSWATWQSSDTGVANVSNAAVTRGQIKGLAAGSAQICRHARRHHRDGRSERQIKTLHSPPSPLSVVARLARSGRVAALFVPLACGGRTADFGDVPGTPVVSGDGDGVGGATGAAGTGGAGGSAGASASGAGAAGTSGATTTGMGGAAAAGGAATAGMGGIGGAGVGGGARAVRRGQRGCAGSLRGLSVGRLRDALERVRGQREVPRARRVRPLVVRHARRWRVRAGLRNEGRRLAGRQGRKRGWQQSRGPAVHGGVPVRRVGLSRHVPGRWRSSGRRRTSGRRRRSSPGGPTGPAEAAEAGRSP